MKKSYRKMADAETHCQDESGHRVRKYILTRTFSMFRLNLVKNINFGLDQKKFFFDTLKNCILGH